MKCLLLSTLGLAALLPVSLPAQVPSAYQDLYTQLTSEIDSFNAVLGTPPPSPTLYAANFSSPNANAGPQLLNPGYWPVIEKELHQLKALGVQAVTVSVSFPILYQPFFPSASEYQDYVNFYTRVAAAVHQLGMKLIVENDTLLDVADPGVVWNAAAFYATLSWTQYQQARAQCAAVVAQTMHPDYLILLEEPHTEANNTGQNTINTVSGVKSLVTQMIASVQNSGVQGIQLGAGVGTWETNFQKIAQALVVLPLNFLDFHLYPMLFNYPENALTIASIAASANPPLPVSLSECWLHKILTSEYGTLDPVTVRSRNPWSFWAPLDTAFLQTMQTLAYYTELIFFAPFDTKEFYAYVSYDATSTFDPVQMEAIEIQTAAQANQQGTFTSTGLAYHNLSVSPPDTIPPSAPAGLAAHARSSTLSWTASTDNIGVEGYYVYRNGIQIASTSLTTFQDTGLTPGVVYTYRVAAYDAAGNVSSQSSPVHLVPPASPPSAPTNLAGTPLSSGKVQLTWTAPSGAAVSHYSVFWGIAPTGLAQIATLTGTSYTDRPLTPNSTYYYAVEAWAPTGDGSPMSAVLSVTTPLLPNPPVLSVSADSTSELTLSWTPAMGAFPISYYYIFRGAASTGLTKLATVRGPVVAYNDKSLLPGTAYYYAVQAIDSAADLSPLSNIASAATQATSR